MLSRAFKLFHMLSRALNQFHMLSDVSATAFKMDEDLFLVESRTAFVSFLPSLLIHFIADKACGRQKQEMKDACYAFRAWEGAYARSKNEDSVAGFRVLLKLSLKGLFQRPYGYSLDRPSTMEKIFHAVLKTSYLNKYNPNLNQLTM